MNWLLKLKLDARLLAVPLMTMAVLWWYSLWLALQTEGFLSGLHLYWGVFFMFFLCGGPFLALGLLLLHAAEGHKHPLWIYPAAGLAVSPWLPAGLWIATSF